MKYNVTACNLIISLATAACLTCGAALADNHSSDVFGRSTGAAKSDPKVPETIFRTGVYEQNGVIHKPPALRWYENFDDVRVSNEATIEDQIALTRPLPSPPTAKSVNEWKATAQAVATKYRHLAQLLKNMPIDNELKADPKSEQIASYRTMLAQWYDDAASWFEDYIKPRAPAQTIEELNDQLNAMHTRSEQLKESMAHLQQMDSSLRQYFQVHSKITDSIQIYAHRKLPSQK